MLDVRRILVPVDFSECSRAALEHAAVFAKAFGAPIDVLHVWEPPRYVSPEFSLQLPDRSRETIGDFVAAEAGKEMDSFLRAFEREDGVEVNTRIASGDVPHTIVELAEGGEYDLVVMGTHGRTGISHLLLGSVAEKVVRHAVCPVLTIRQPKEAR